jgi:hypothetical protein
MPEKGSRESRRFAPHEAPPADGFPISFYSLLTRAPFNTISSGLVEGRPMSYRFITAIVIAVSLCAAAAAGRSEKNVWKPFHPLVGTWSGTGSGFGSESDVTHQWNFAIGGQFLQLRTTSIARNGDGAADVHEDVGFLSYDTDRSSFVFRQFVSEGFVNTFDVTLEHGDTLTIVFGARASESAGGMRARMTLEFISDDEYEMVLELAGPGRSFSPCRSMRLKKEEER